MSLSSIIDKNELKLAQQLINKSKIPSPPKLLMDLKTELSLAEPDMHKIDHWVSEDIGLAARVIKTINSPLFGLKVEVKSIEQAIHLLGMNKLRDIIIPPAYRHAMEQSLDGFETISENSHQVGTMAYMVSGEIESETEQKGGTFYLSGLFHHVGVLVLGTQFPDYLAQHEQHALNPVSWGAIELKNYGVRHTTVGVLLAKHWGLPNIVCSSIYLHHNTVSTYRELIDTESITVAASLTLANHIVNKDILELPVDESKECQTLYESVMEELMLSEDSFLNFEQDAKSIY